MAAGMCLRHSVLQHDMHPPDAHRLMVDTSCFQLLHTCTNMHACLHGRRLAPRVSRAHCCRCRRPTSRRRSGGWAACRRSAASRAPCCAAPPASRSCPWPRRVCGPAIVYQTRSTPGHLTSAHATYLRALALPFVLKHMSQPHVSSSTAASASGNTPHQGQRMTLTFLQMCAGGPGVELRGGHGAGGGAAGGGRLLVAPLRPRRPVRRLGAAGAHPCSNSLRTDTMGCGAVWSALNCSSRECVRPHTWCRKCVLTPRTWR